MTDEEIVGQSSRTTPALATFGDQVPIVHPAQDATALWHSLTEVVTE